MAWETKEVNEITVVLAGIDVMSNTWHMKIESKILV
jgi:hypothetical protein